MMYYTIFTLRIGTPIPLTIFVLKFETVHSTLLMCLKYCCMYDSVDLEWHLIWVYTVCRGLSVSILKVITILISSVINVMTKCVWRHKETVTALTRLCRSDQNMSSALLTLKVLRKITIEDTPIIFSYFSGIDSSPLTLKELKKMAAVHTFFLNYSSEKIKVLAFHVNHSLSRFSCNVKHNFL